MTPSDESPPPAAAGHGDRGARVTTHTSPCTEAVETVGGVILDLLQIADILPPQPGQTEPIAKMLDRLAVEVREAAQLLRIAAGSTASAARGALPGLGSTPVRSGPGVPSGSGVTPDPEAAS